MSPLAAQVQARRIARGKEPLTLAHVERAIRFVAGGRPPLRRHPSFGARPGATCANEWSDKPTKLHRVYGRGSRGRAA